MSATISSINYSLVKSVSFQSIDICKIKKNIEIVGNRIFAFAKNLEVDKALLFDNPQNERTKHFLHAVLDAN